MGVFTWLCLGEDAGTAACMHAHLELEEQRAGDRDLNVINQGGMVPRLELHHSLRSTQTAESSLS